MGPRGAQIVHETLFPSVSLWVIPAETNIRIGELAKVIDLLVVSTPHLIG